VAAYAGPPWTAGPRRRGQHRHARTPYHFNVARSSPRRGTRAVEEAHDHDSGGGAKVLIEAARRANRNTAWGIWSGSTRRPAVQPILTTRASSESAPARAVQAYAGRTRRRADLDDCHDIDLILSIVRLPVVSSMRSGSSGVFPRRSTLRTPRLRFANGCVAQCNGQPSKPETERRLRLFQDDAYVSVDLQQKVLTVDPQGTRG